MTQPALCHFTGCFNIWRMPRGVETFKPIRVSTLRGDLKIPFDVYIFVAGKHILYCRQGDSFEGKRLERLKAKKLKTMYVRPEDDVPYRQYLEQSIDTAYDNKAGKAIETRAEVIQGFQQAAAEEYMEDPLNEFTYRHVRSSVQRFVEFIKSEPMGTKAIMDLKNIDQSVTHHGVTVAALSVAITLENNLRDGQPLHLMALGCLLHDIEHFFSGMDLSRPLISFSDAELKEYKEHLLKGAQRLQAAPFVDGLVLNIIAQHDEHMDGTGFPKGLFERDMDPLVMISGVANAYDHLVCFENMNPKEALRTLLIGKMGKYPLGFLQNLQTVLKKHQII